MKKCGLYIRVSTDRQARVQEGSLKNQDQLLTQHVEYKNKMGQDQWLIVDRYIDGGRSAKDTKNRPEYQRMMRDIEKGRIDTILCLALSRISRSTRDLLDMVAYFKEKTVGFVCLKEDFDTTTPQGICFLTIMGALNQFEREQTSERTRLNMLARAERGLWNGGQLLGYDLNPQRKGHILPNDAEKLIVNFCFDTYLECGSIQKTSQAANAKDYRTKQYTTKHGKLRSSKAFSYTSMWALLTNCAYIGKREINKRWKHLPQDKLPEEKRYKTTDAVWEAIVDRDKFHKAQKLIKDNCKHKNNGAKPSKHFYLFNGGILHCHKCGSLMEGRSAYGRAKKIYYYYYCSNRDCNYKLSEAEIEGVLRDAMKKVSGQDSILTKIVEKTNVRLKKEMPRLVGHRQTLQKELDSLNGKAGHIMEKYMGVTDGEDFVKEGLAVLSQKKRQLIDDIAIADITINGIEKESVDENFIGEIFHSFDEIYRDEIKPYQKKELLFHTLTKVELSDTKLKVGIPLEHTHTLGTSTPIAEQIRTPASAGGAIKKAGATFVVPAFFYALPLPQEGTAATQACSLATH